MPVVQHLQMTELIPESYPIDVIYIAATRGITVYKRPLPDKVSGILHKFPGRSYLYLNANHTIERQRFTVAHELAHHLFDPAGTYLAHSEAAMTARERRANKYAAEILMPASEVLRCLGRNMSLQEMMAHFGVSEEAMTRRIQEIGEKGGRMIGD